MTYVITAKLKNEENNSNIGYDNIKKAEKAVDDMYFEYGDMVESCNIMKIEKIQIPYESPFHSDFYEMLMSMNKKMLVEKLMIHPTIDLNVFL